MGHAENQWIWPWDKLKYLVILSGKGLRRLSRYQCGLIYKQTGQIYSNLASFTTQVQRTRFSAPREGRMGGAEGGDNQCRRVYSCKISWQWNRRNLNSPLITLSLEGRKGALTWGGSALEWDQNKTRSKQLNKQKSCNALRILGLGALNIAISPLIIVR